MKEPFDLQQLFVMYRHELGYSFVACCVAVARHWQQGDPFREIVTNGALCALVAFGINNVLEYFTIDSAQWGYLASVFLGYVGVEAVMSGLADRLPFIPKKGDPKR